MARSDYKTWLALDEFAQILGLDPLAFNQLSSNTLRRNNVCGDIFYQSDWQHSDRIGRDTIAIAIQQAEQEMAAEAGFNLMPDWTLSERLAYPRPALPELYGSGVNARWMAKSVELNKAHVLYGGIRAKTLIEAGAAIVRSDEDVDGYQETCTVTVATTITATDEIRAYYPAKSGDDGWEIRPIKVSISGGFATITFKAWQVIAANQMDSLDPSPLDADAAASYETTIDVYRIYTDTSDQLQFLWEGDPATLNCCNTCTACQLGAQDGCFHLRDARIGFIVPTPATYDSTSAAWTSQEWSACREPDQIIVNYYSGYRDLSLSRPYSELSNYWKFAVAVFAASKFERAVCGCSNVNQFIEKWRRDAAFASQNEGGFTVTAELAANRLGTTMGALYAYRKIQQAKVNK